MSPTASAPVFESHMEEGWCGEEASWLIKVFGVPKSETCCASSLKRIWGDQKTVLGKWEAGSRVCSHELSGRVCLNVMVEEGCFFCAGHYGV